MKTVTIKNFCNIPISITLEENETEAIIIIKDKLTEIEKTFVNSGAEDE